MAEMLLINPRRRRRKTARKSNPSPAQKRARAAFAAASRGRARKRRARNPAPRRAARVLRRRRRNPVAVVRTRRSSPVLRRAARRVARRRRNPISLGSASGYIAMLKDGLIGGAGAIAVDLVFGQLAPYLPASLRRVPGEAGVGDAVKAMVTIALGQLLDGVTKGLSQKAAKGALVVQAHGLIAQMLPNTMTLGYATPSMMSNMSTRIGPNRNALMGMGRYTAPGASQMLGRYTAPGATQMLASRGRTMSREMGSVR